MAIQLKQTNKETETTAKEVATTEVVSSKQVVDTNQTETSTTQLVHPSHRKSGSKPPLRIYRNHGNASQLGNTTNPSKPVTLRTSHEIKPNSTIQVKELSEAIQGAKHKSTAMATDAKDHVSNIQKNDFPDQTKKPTVLNQGKGNVELNQLRQDTDNLKNGTLTESKVVLPRPSIAAFKKQAIKGEDEQPLVENKLDEAVIEMIHPREMTPEEELEFLNAQEIHRRSLGIMTNDEIHSIRKYHHSKFQPNQKMFEDADNKYVDYFVDPSTRQFNGDTYYKRNFTPFQYYTNEQDHREIYATDKVLMNKTKTERHLTKNIKGLYTRSRYYQTYTLKNAGVVIEAKNKAKKYDLKEWKTKGVKHF